LKVLHFGRFDAPYFGGLERHVTLLLEGLKRYIKVDNLVSNDCFRTEAEVMDGYTVYRVASLGLLAGTALSPTMPWWAWRLYQQKHYDILHLHFPDPLSHFVTYCLPRAVKIVITWHSDIIRQKNWLRLYQPALNHVLRRADAIIAATPKHFSCSTQLSIVRDAAKLHVVPYGIHYEKFTPTSEILSAAERIRRQYEGRKLIFTVGRMVYYKGFDYLLHAMKHIDGVLLLGGVGPLLEHYKTIAASLRLGDKAVFLGRIPDCNLPAYYYAAEVFCMPSVEPSEAFGLVQLEAMACKKPVVCCELGNGVSYVNQHNITGLVVPPRDVSALACAINTLLDDAQLRHAMGTAGYERATREFSIDRMVQGTLEVYQRVLGVEA
jgi:glycosyltransferase involved in cell wall biosynthesis